MPFGFEFWRDIVGCCDGSCALCSEAIVDCELEKHRSVVWVAQMVGLGEGAQERVRR